MRLSSKRPAAAPQSLCRFAVSPAIALKHPVDLFVKSIAFHHWRTSTTRAFLVSSAAILSSWFFVVPAAADQPAVSTSTIADSDNERQRIQSVYQSTVIPLVKQYCLDCHNHETAEGELDLSMYQSVESVARDHRHWSIVASQIDQRIMPPESEEQPTDADRAAILNWIGDFQKFEAAQDAGNPGQVLARRLSNAEFDYTIRDLTGVDIRPTREFPIDPANEAGFDNTGESLAMSPSLLNKYLDAARSVASHLVLMPDRFEFAPYPVVADTDLDKFCVNRIIDFYKHQPIDYKDYFFAAWKYHNRQILGFPEATIQDIAKQEKVSPKYLAAIYGLLTQKPGEHESVGPIAALRTIWHEMPVANATNHAESHAAAQSKSQAMRDFVTQLRASLVPTVANLTAPSVNHGSQPLVLWKNRQFAANRQRYSGGALKPGLAGLPDDSPAAKAMTAPDDLDASAEFQKSFDRFCYLFPDAFMVTERARVYLDPEQEKSLKGRFLSAGFHNQMGYFRDDAPLYDLILSDDQRREIDRLWEEFYFAASIPFRQYSSFIWFERAESGFLRDEQFDFARAEDKDCASPEKIARLSSVYRAKALDKGASDIAMQAIDDYFQSTLDTFSHYDSLRAASHEHHLNEVLEFAARAYRRPLTEDEQAGLLQFYTTLRTSDGLGHADAIRDCVVAVLVSPNFCFRVDTPIAGTETTRPLTDLALASRLSYFLWSSMPDAELLELAQAGRLHDPSILQMQTARMLKDPKSRALALEFGGNWLDFRHFDQHNAVDRQRFPAFDNDLRQSMFEEPIRYLLDVFQHNTTILDLLDSNHIIVNQALAKHYGVPAGETFAQESQDPSSNDNDVWMRIDDSATIGRGGLVSMSVFLTKNAPGLRTSPVKRGYWVARRLLGEYIPPPPNDVPELPADEAKMGELTLRDALQKHREDKACASCHERFDALGLALESFGPVGERRQFDLGGKPVDDGAIFPDGLDRKGIDGLREYIAVHRRDDFVNHLIRSLMSYALGRSLLLSDEPTIDSIRNQLADDNFRFHTLVQRIVTSPQFLNKRMSD